MTTPIAPAHRPTAPAHTPANAPLSKPAENKPAENKPVENNVTSSFISQPIMLDIEPELVKASAPRNARSEEQKAMDAVVSNLHKKWAAEGKSTTWSTLAAKKCVATYIVEPSDVTKIRQLVNRATALHSVRARYGTDVTVTPAMLSKYGMPDNYLGRTVVSFAIMDKRPRDIDPEVTKRAVQKAQATRAAKKATK